MLSPVTALVAAALVLAGLSLTQKIRSQARPMLVEPSARGPVAQSEAPSLRLTEALDPPANPSAAASADEAALRAQARLPRVRAGAPEPLIIDVRQALASLRRRDPPQRNGEPEGRFEAPVRVRVPLL
jgi:hypothetical protein